MPNTQHNVETSPLNITLNFHDSESAAVVTFVAKNISADPIFVFSPLSRISEAGLVPDSQRAYVNVVDDVCVIQKTLFDVPHNIDVYMPEVPLLTKLAPGESLTEALVFKKPIYASFPYQEFIDATPHKIPVRTSGLILELGFLTTNVELMSLHSRDDGHFEIDFAEGIANQRIAQSELISSTLEVSF